MRILLISLSLLLTGCAAAPQPTLLPILHRTMINDLALLVWRRYPPALHSVALSTQPPAHTELAATLRKLGYAIHADDTASGQAQRVQLHTEPLDAARWLLTVHWGSTVFARAYGPVRGGAGWAATSPWSQREAQTDAS